ncbi:armadillo-type protein, partial [Gymnopilus junonius]
MELDEPMDVVPQKRFKHQSYNQSLKQVHLPSAFKQSHLAHDVADNESHFHEALDHWRQLNLAPSFLSFAHKADGLSASMPLLLHNWRDIYDLWLEAFHAADDEGLRALLDLLQKMAHDLRTTLSPIYTSLLETLLALLPRAVSPQALTSLLETLSSIFRHLLVPAIDTSLLEETWKTMCSILPKCFGEIQRAVAEVWAGVLRRMKSGSREKAVRLLAENTSTIGDATAWVVVYACKSVSQTLHTCAPSIFTPLISYHLFTASDPKATYTLLRRTLTALIHHVKNAEGFTLVGQVLVERFISLVKEEENMEPLKRMLDVMAVVSGVRQGSRLTDSQKLTLFSDLDNLPVLPGTHAALLRYITSLFIAGEMSLWLGPGLKFFRRTWTFTPSTTTTTPALPQSNFTDTPLSFTLKLHLCLADAGFGGWKFVALPVLFKSVMKPELGLIESERRRLLAGKKLGGGVGGAGDLDIVLRNKIEGLVLGRFGDESWKEGTSDDAVAELDDILTLLPLCISSITPSLISIVDSYIDTNQPSVTISHILGLCMQALAKRDPTEWTTKVNTEKWARRGLEKWSWSHKVLAGLVAVAQASPNTKQIPIHEVYPLLYTPLISHSRPLRLSALRLLDSKLIDPTHDQVEVLKRCLQGEEVALDIQGVRERVLRIGRVGQVVGDEKGADLCARWLISQLKVNLRPLWSPAAAALAALSARFGELVWRLLFDELRKVTGDGEMGEGAGAGIGGRGQEGERMEEGVDDLLDSDPWEEERTWRDPSAHKLRSIVIIWDDPAGERRRRLKEQADDERFDVQSYEHQLLSTLGECHSLAEKHSRDLIPHFLALSGPSTFSSSLPKTKLLAWLTLFSKFANPKALYATDTLRGLYFAYLSHPDRALQNISLACILAYKSPSLMPYEERIRALLDDTRWRDELSLMQLDDIPPTARAEVMEVFIQRKGRGRISSGGGADRRAAVLSTFTGCTDQELGLVVDLMLRPFGWDRTPDEAHERVFQSGGVSVSDKQFAGYLTLLGDVLKQLGSRLKLYWPALLGMAINLTATAQARIDGSLGSKDAAAEGEEPVVEDSELIEVEGADSGPATSTKATRSIRQLGLKRFADFFRIPVLFDFSPYMPAIFDKLITPRLPALDKENTQSPSALLELFHVWTVDGIHIPLLADYNTDTLPRIFDCLVATSVKPSVISRIFDIVDNVLSCSAEDEYTRDNVLKPHVSRLLANIAVLVERTKGVSAIATPIGQRQINILSEIAQYSSDAEQASTLLVLFNPLLRRPVKVVPEKVKLGLVKIIGELMHLIPDLKDNQSQTHTKTYGLISQLFQSLRSRPARLALVATFHRLAAIDPSLAEVANLLEAMNSYSVKRMDEPDFERRIQAFTLLNETLYKSITCSQWMPILQNMLNFIQDPEELSVRNSASYAMRHFIDFVVAGTSAEYEEMFLKVLYPGLKNGLRSKNELVRAEILGVIAYAVTKCENIASLQDMRVLLEGGDEEANFFNNILHVQVHRRSRALRRLADHCEKGHLRSTTIAEIFVPSMAKQLSWGPYYALVQKYIKLSKLKDESERVYIRALVAVLDHFHFPMDDTIAIPEPVDEDAAAEDDEEVDQGPAEQATLTTKEFQKIARIADAVNLRLLPSLLNHLEQHDETTDDNARIPISIGIVTVAKHLSAGTREGQIGRLITILSQILRSKSQETRDLIRESLNRIAVSLGPPYLPVILRELRAALFRGPQLHVLAFAVHSLITHIANGEHAEQFTVLDDCVNDVAHVSAEVIFGESGKDVDSEGFKTKMKEVRTSSSKGLDSFAIISKYITPPKISSLLAPIKAIMHETESAKVMGLVEEVLKRIAAGLNSNKHLVETEFLALCNTLISQNAKFLQQMPSRRKNNVKGDHIVQMKRKVAADVDHYSSNSFRFVTFGLELLNTALKRNRLDFRDSTQLARLEAMVVVVGNTLYSTNAAVLMLGMRCAAGLAKCPLKSVEKSLPVTVRQILDIIKQTGNTESELVLVAFKSLATILRDGPPVQVKEKDLVYLLELLSPDLEEPERQAPVFTLLRAIVARKFVVPEIYDLMQKVSEISVTSQSTQVQELCRGVLLQFLLDYPQGKGRLRNQMTFFAKNLSYIYESGRVSIMELLSAVIVKFQANLIQEYADLLFMALVMVVANDESAKCREMAAQLIKNLWSRLDEERRNVLLSHLHTWAAQTAQPLLTWVSMQVYGFVVDVAQAETGPFVSSILDDITSSLQRSVTITSAAEDEADASQMEVEIEWQLPYHSLTVLSKVLKVFPDLAKQENKVDWTLVVNHLLFPHAWVRTAACRLLGVLFSAVPVAVPQTDLPAEHPLSRVGMQLTARRLAQQLKSEHLDASLGLQVVKNLFYLGKCFYLIPPGDITPIDNDAVEMLENEDADAHQGGNEEKLKNLSNPLPWLFSKLSYQIRSGHIARRNKPTSKVNWSQQSLVGLRWFAAMASHMEAERLEQFLVHILTPVYRLTEEDTIRDSQMEELKTTAIELQDLVQSKVGTTKFANVYNQIRQSVLGVRRERKVARALQVSTNPEAAAKRKMQRNVVKKDSRKRKERSFLEAKGKIKRQRQE